jgi:hypothetical protein
MISEDGASPRPSSKKSKGKNVGGKAAPRSADKHKTPRRKGGKKKAGKKGRRVTPADVRKDAIAVAIEAADAARMMADEALRAASAETSTQRYVRLISTWFQTYPTRVSDPTRCHPHFLLDCSRVKQTNSEMVIVTHGCLSWFVGISGYVTCSLCSGTLFFLILMHIIGRYVEWSPQYEEQKRIDSLSVVMRKNYSTPWPAPLPYIGHWAWAIQSGMVVFGALACCWAPPRKTLRLNKETGLFQAFEQTFDCCNFFCGLRMPCKKRLRGECALDDLEARVSKQPMGNASDCGPGWTPMRLFPHKSPTLELVEMPEDHLLYFIDAPAMLCCYFDAARCCRALGFYHVQQLHLRIDRFLLATYRPTEDPGEFDGDVEIGEVSFLLCTVTFYANLAHNLTRSP